MQYLACIIDWWFCDYIISKSFYVYSSIYLPLLASYRRPQPETVGQKQFTQTIYKWKWPTINFERSNVIRVHESATAGGRRRIMATIFQWIAIRFLSPLGHLKYTQIFARTFTWISISIWNRFSKPNERFASLIKFDEWMNE